ncbi:conserved Plasmodium protein, unknown function [Plasmodium gallinaceum]|uniref:FHA domain-containing protein n=1 Tax=Plasmodium gallinaceum TaxID=5849 RepID=A0A1J1GUQ3_PLAGA|nr:conserved Plasmodium protein, unknown function [Plasmodium gallinaceum]CRG96273.1 conserved Plasmodium protein, unknown function [Plasmodium gallinaceum]
MQNFVNLGHIRTNNAISENHNKELKNIEEISKIDENNENNNDKNCLVNENIHDDTSNICNNRIDEKHTITHSKTKDIVDKNFLIYSSNYLSNNRTGEILNNDVLNTKNLEEAVNRRRKIREMISAYNSLNLSSCDLNNVDIQKKISLHNFEYNNNEDDKCESAHKSNEIKQNYSDKFDKNQNMKDNNLNYDSSITCKNNVLSLNNYSNNCNKDIIKARISENILNKSFINDDDEIDDYKTFLTLDSNQTIFKKKPLKLPDISFLNSKSRNYNSICNNNNDDDSNNDILRKKIIYEKLDLSSSYYEDNQNMSFASQYNSEHSAIQKRAGINEFNKNYVNNNFNFHELKNESKNNIVKNYIKINKVENSNIEQLINNNISNSNNYVDNKVKRYAQKNLKENNYENKLLPKNAFDISYFKYSTLHNSRKTSDINNNIHNSIIKTKNEENTKFMNEISNTSIIYPSENKCSNISENVSKKEHNIYSNSKYANTYDENINDKVNFTLEEKAYMNSSYIKNLEKFKELLFNATKDNLNEYIKCLQNINNKKLKNYKYYVKQVNNYNISQYLNTTFKASVPQKNIKESMLNNSDTFSSIQKCINESDDLSTTTYSDNSSSSNFEYKDLINSNNNNNNFSLKIYKGKKKSHLKNTSTLSTTPTNEINSCSEKVKNKISFSLLNKNKEKKYDKSSYNNVRPKMSTVVINKNDFLNIKENHSYNLKRLDNLNVKKIKKDEDLDKNDSFKNNYINKTLKKNSLYETLGKYITEEKLYNSDYAKNYNNYDKNSFKEYEYIHSLKKKEKKKKKKYINNSIYVYNSKNKNKYYFPFNTDSEDYIKQVNDSSLSMLQSNSCENNYKELLSNEELNKSNNQTNNTTKNKNVLHMNNLDNNKYEKCNYHESDKSLRQSSINCTDDLINKNVLCNINQDNMNEKSFYEFGNIRTNEIINVNNSYEKNRNNINKEDFSNINFLKNGNSINIHDNISKNKKTESDDMLYTQNHAYMNNINDNYLNEKKKLFLIKKNSEDFPMCDEKLIKTDSVNREHNYISYKDYNLNKNSFYFNNANSKNKLNDIMRKNENILMNNIKREDLNNSICENKKEKENESIDVLNFNFQNNLHNNVNLSKNKFEVSNNIQEYHHNCEFPEHVNKNLGKDIKEIMKNNKTRIENIYDNEENQNDLYLSENTSEMKYNINENTDDNKTVHPSLNKFDYFYKSIKENSFSTNSCNGGIENESVIRCSLDSFNEEFDNPISAPTPAASSFSNISLSSSCNKNFNKWNILNINNNQTNNINEIHNHLNNQSYYANIEKFKKDNLYNYNNNRKINSDKSNTDNENYNNSNEKNINVNSLNDKNMNNIYENYIHENNNNKDKCSYFVNNSINKKYEKSDVSTDLLKNNTNYIEHNFDFMNNKKGNDNSQISVDKKYIHFTNSFKNNVNKKNIFDTLSESSINNRKSVNSIITNNINNLDKNFIHNNENLINPKSLYKEIDNNYSSKKNNSFETLNNNLINLTEPNWNYKKTDKNNTRKIVNTLEIKNIKINTKQGIFEITPTGEVIFTFLGRSEIKKYKNVKKKNINIDISKPRKLLFIIEIDGINIKIKDLLMNEILDYYNIFEEELPKAHNARYEYAYNVIETLKKHTPKVSLKKKWFGIYNLMSNGSTPDFTAILNNNMFIEKVEIKNNHVTFILKDRTSITLHIDDLNGITTNFTKKTIEKKEKIENNIKEKDNFIKEMKGDNEDIKVILMNLQKLLQKTGVSIDIIIQNWCDTLHAYSYCLNLLTKGNTEYTLKLKKTLAYITEKTEIHKRNIYFSIFPIIVEE